MVAKGCWRRASCACAQQQQQHSAVCCVLSRRGHWRMLAPVDEVALRSGVLCCAVSCRQVSLEEGDSKARELSVNFIETSAKAGFNIKVSRTQA